MRLFFAINFSDAARSRLCAFQNELRPRAAGGNFTLRENLHLTLAFLGECSGRQLASAQLAMEAVDLEPFSLTIAGGGGLEMGRPNLVFCGLESSEGGSGLLRLQASLHSSLAARGFALPERAFWPHITLGRRVVWRDSPLTGIVFPQIEESVTGFELMRSERLRGRLRYTPVKERRAP